MPIYRVACTVTSKRIAYIQAPSRHAAKAWAENAIHADFESDEEEEWIIAGVQQTKLPNSWSLATTVDASGIDIILPTPA